MIIRKLKLKSEPEEADELKIWIKMLEENMSELPEGYGELKRIRAYYARKIKASREKID